MQQARAYFGLHLQVLLVRQPGDVVAVKEAELAEVHAGFIFQRLAKALLDALHQGGVIVALAPGAVRAADAYRRVSDLLDPHRHAANRQLLYHHPRLLEE